jgi:hypothetical protein
MCEAESHAASLPTFERYLFFTTPSKIRLAIIPRRRADFGGRCHLSVNRRASRLHRIFKRGDVRLQIGAKSRWQSVSLKIGVERSRFAVKSIRARQQIFVVQTAGHLKFSVNAVELIFHRAPCGRFHKAPRADSRAPSPFAQSPAWCRPARRLLAAQIFENTDFRVNHAELRRPDAARRKIRRIVRLELPHANKHFHPSHFSVVHRIFSCECEFFMMKPKIMRERCV